MVCWLRTGGAAGDDCALENGSMDADELAAAAALAPGVHTCPSDL